MKFKKVLALAVAVQMIMASNAPIFAQDSNEGTFSSVIEGTTSNSSGGGYKSVINNATDNAEKTNSSKEENKVDGEISTQSAENAEHALVITGGTEGTDYTYENGVVTIETSTPLTIANKDIDTATTDRIIVPKGVSVDVTFAGVNIAPTTNSPFTLTPSADGNGAKAHITLADGTVNTLTASENGYPGLRCGKTTTLTIDDSVLNIDNKGKEITPKLGVIPEDVTLSNGTSLKKGSKLTQLDSKNPGKLITNSAPNAAGIGGGGYEDGGTMVFNGGSIASTSYGTADNNDYGGAGIGGGSRGCGGNIVINGGIITAQGARHGAGVGGGFGWTSCNPPVITPMVVDPDMHRGQSGNITINGGLTYSNGGYHGNGFGEGCTVGGENAENYQIIVTGGTVIAKAGTGKGSDLGGEYSDVYVLGGSLKASTFTSHGGNKAYGDMDKKTQVFMTKIDLASWGLDKVGTALVEDIDMKIAGVNYQYGMPSYTDPDGYLYFWLPNSSDIAGQEISVDLNVRDNTTGERLKTDTFFITKATANSSLKQYVNFEIPEGTLSQDSIKKHYDGTAHFDSDEMKNAVAALKIQTTLPTGEFLDDATKLDVQAQRLKDDGVTVEDNAEIVGMDQGLVGGGKYQLIITSTQYANSNKDNFKDAYWGHRTYFKYAEIEPADTQIALDIKNKVEDTDYVRPDRQMTFKASVSPASNEATTCASPKGKVQFYINGKPYGDPVNLEAQDEVNASGYHYSTASITWTAADGSYVKPGDTAEVTVKYIGNDSNYNNGCEAKDKLVIAEYNPVITGKTGHALTFDGVPNMKYDVKTKDGTKVGEVTTDANGKAVVKGLDKNTEYTITNTDFGTSTGKTLPEDAEDIANRFREDEKDKASHTGDGLDEKASNSKVDVSIDENGNYKVILKDTIKDTTVTIPDDWGNITIDLNGKDIKGADATNKKAAGSGMEIKKEEDSTGENGTNLDIIDSTGNGKIKGGDGSKEYPNGADGITTGKKNEKPEGTTITVGENAEVIGGKGATGTDGNGGNGGNGISGTTGVEVKGGTIIGGNGGNGADKKDENGGNGGNGGTGIKTDDQPVKVETGKVNGGNGGAGGSSENKDGGEAGEGGKTVDAGKADSTTNKDAEITEGNKGEKGKDKTSEVKGNESKDPEKDDKQDPTGNESKDPLNDNKQNITNDDSKGDKKDNHQQTTGDVSNNTNTQVTVNNKDGQTKKSSKVKTGDDTSFIIYGVFVMISVLGILLLKKKAHN